MYFYRVWPRNITKTCINVKHGFLLVWGEERVGLRDDVLSRYTYSLVGFWYSRICFIGYGEYFYGDKDAPHTAFNPRQCRGGGGASPHEFFLNGRRTAGRIALKFCVPFRHPLRNFWQKKMDRVRSGHGAMRSQEKQPPADFSRKSCFQPRDLLTWTGMGTLCMI